MPEFAKVAAGKFCWVELQTTDVDAAKRFYGGLLGWDLADMPMPSGNYAMASVGGKSVAGLLAQAPDQKKQSVPPSWLSYVAVDNVEASAGKGAELGGTLLVPPMAMGPGKFAVLTDPAGAMFALWQAGQSMGPFLYGETGALGWNELYSSNVDRAAPFYAKLFGWKPEQSDMASGKYTVFKAADEDATIVAGMMEKPPELAEAPSFWGVYFCVADTDKAAARVKELGGKLLEDPMEIPGIGRFAPAADPQGATFSIIKFAR
jgi:predicted enzyme related to lactoylglutathione lyase